MSGKILGSAPEHRVLVTGCPRSGTTFAGTVLSFPREVDYFHEPLNPECGLPSVTRRHMDLADSSSGDIVAELEALFDYEPVLRGATYSSDGLVRQSAKRFIGARGPAHLTMARWNPWSEHIVIKDPFAVRSLDWFIDRGVQVVGIVRHPAAVAASHRRLGWRAEDLRDTLTEILDGTDSSDPHLERARHGSDLESAAAIWSVLTSLLVRDPRVHLVLHEHLSADPVREFAALRSRLGLPWSRIAERRLERMTSGNRAAARSGPQQQLRRSSHELSAAALASLTDHEIRSVWSIAGDVAQRWYGPRTVS